MRTLLRENTQMILTITGHCSSRLVPSTSCRREVDTFCIQPHPDGMRKVFFGESDHG